MTTPSAQPSDAPPVDDPQSFAHRFSDLNGIRLHYVEEGQGPLVLLLHGFPYLWYMWRRQIRALAQAGFRVVAPDLRGFGQTDAPSEVQAYSMLHSVGDMVGLLHVLGEKSAVVVGHDLGAWVAYAAAQMRPDLFRALVMLNTPVPSREARTPSATWKLLAGDSGRRFYHHYFQTPGEAETTMNADIRKTLRSAFYSISGSAVGHERWRLFIEPGETFLDTVFDPSQFPVWVCPQGMDYYVNEYTRKGFAGPLNHYRMRDRNWEQSAFLEGLQLPQPALFIGGAADPALERFVQNYETMESHLPKLRKKVLLEGVGHSAAEEKPYMVNELLLHFLREL